VVRDQVLDKLSFTFEDLGAHEVKNIIRPIEVYRVDLGSGVSQPASSDRGRLLRPARAPRWWPLAAGAIALGILAVAVMALLPLWKTVSAPVPPPLSIAVLPFAAPLRDPADEQFADALTQSLATALGRWRIATVASTSSVASYKGRSIDPRTAGRELNVRQLVEGDVRTAADKVTVTVRLIDAGTGTQAWNVQRELTKSQVAEGPTELAAWLATRMRANLRTTEQQRAARVPMAEATPLDLLLRSDAEFEKDPTLKGAIEARRLLDEALRRDPEFVPAMVAHADYDLGELEFTADRERSERLLREAEALTTRAVALAPADAAVWNTRTRVFAAQQRWEPALEANAVSMKLDPTNSNYFTTRALLFLFSGQAASALPLTDKAIALDPMNASWARLIECHVYLLLARMDDAIASCEKSIGQFDEWPVYVYLTAAYAQKGNAEKAASTMAELVKRRPDATIDGFRALYVALSNQPVFRQQTEEHVFGGLRKAGLPER
jgi:adenylate cyclase